MEMILSIEPIRIRIRYDEAALKAKRLKVMGSIRDIRRTIKKSFRYRRFYTEKCGIGSHTANWTSGKLRSIPLIPIAVIIIDTKTDAYLLMHQWRKGNGAEVYIVLQAGVRSITECMRVVNVMERRGL
ncbi:hypothetical protein EVAR_73966_1 [Eumeta japonica]|uniref:Uncharacterized protein n=1 Tax=Eumeta variegata TaxID=151549 RepID=A0A4C1TGG2_EUMVA|nr:hypothetical protein EVAR_73966_1 [Eumeta japonica]